MIDPAKIKFAIVGCGRIGKRYIQLLVQHPQTELTALIDVKAATETEVDTRLPYFKSLEEFFSSGINADIIVIASPNGLHAEQAIKCLEHGFHVLIEKPIALKVEDAQKIFERAESAGKYAFAVMQIRYAAAAKWLKTLIDAGELGVRQEDLAADIDQRGRMVGVQLQRQGLDRAQVLRDLRAGRAVAAGRALHEDAVLIGERDRQPV